MYGGGGDGAGRGDFGGRGGGGRGGGPKPRQYTAPGQMTAGANNRPPLADLDPHMRQMFLARPPLEFKPPVARKKPTKITGISQLLGSFETTPAPPPAPFELPAERRKRIREHMKKLHDEKNELLVADWDPHNNPHSTENAYHTLFVARLSFETTEKKLRREFEQYGPIKTIRLVQDLDDKSRGYAFIEFEREEDMTIAYKKSDSKKIDGRRILVDVERGRTVRNWRPRRFGGGLGGRKDIKSKKQLEEEAKAAATAGGGDRGRVSAYGPPGGGGGDRFRDGGRDAGRDSYRGGGGGGYGGRDNRDSGRGRDSIYGSGRSTGSDSRTRERSRSRDRDRDRRDDRDRDRDRDRSDKDRERRRSRSRDRDRR